MPNDDVIWLGKLLPSPQPTESKYVLSALTVAGLSWWQGSL